MITNTIFTSQEKEWLEFFVKHSDECGKGDVIEEQLNNCSFVKRDYSDYFLIMHFNSNTENIRKLDDMRSCTVQVLQGNVPTVLLMLFDEGIIESFEIYYADSGKLDVMTMLEGNGLLVEWLMYRFKDI